VAETLQIRFCGFGGQGILLMGALLGEAAVRQGHWAAGSNSYGAQARGSGCRSDVVVSRDAVDYPHVVEADLLVALAPDAYRTYLRELSPGGIVVHDDPYVPAIEDPRPRVPVAATRTAVEALGNRQVANMVMLAAAAALTDMAKADALRAAVEHQIAPRFLELNLRAVEMGLAMGERARQEHAAALAPWLRRFSLSS
jgi:2-oxoglutarate ferredoxin oxidoreductase subunit gamma